MENTRFAKSSGCFYPYTENYKELPEDIIEVPMTDYYAAMERNPDEVLDVVDGRVVVVPRPAPTAEELRVASLSEARAYLNSTDWYLARKIETDEPVPEEVAQKRAKARALLQG